MDDLKPKFIHRDLSWLSFNERVLDEALDTENPLLERIKFLAIVVNNLDEFFMVRLAILKRLLDSGYNRKDNFGYSPQDVFLEIKTKNASLIAKLYDTYYGKIFGELEKNKILFKKYSGLTAEQKRYAKRYFDTTIFPITTPMALDQGHPFPALPSKTIAFAVSVSRGDKTHLAIIPIPKVIPRILKLPSEKDEFSFILIEEIIREHLDNFFRGYKIISASLFRLIRDSELSVSEDYAPDLLKAIEDEIKKRPRAKVVYLESESSAKDELLELLCKILDFPKEEVSSISGDLDLTFLFELIPHIHKPDLLYRSYTPAKPDYQNIFDKIKEGDFLTHLPYQSFEPTIDFLQSASSDDNVLAIKMTLYRTNEDSAIIKALKEAAKNRKQVTVLVELKARFEEEKNITWAKELEESGCHVIYGMPGIKIHSKMTLIVRKEEGRINRYVHLSSGNYNEKTAKVYTDIGYFSSNDDFAKDISDVFNVITGYSLPSRWKRIISSPYDLRQYFFELIDKEMECQKKYKNGFIFAKINSLEDTQIIEKLYAASCAGVKIRLIVRGICSLIPRAAGMSENIEVKSIVGRFLEHSRIFMFNNNSNYRMFLSSADWMSRNFDRRIEILFEIYKEEIKDNLKLILETYWKDNVKSRGLKADGNYAKEQAETEGINAQEFFVNYYAG